MPCFYIRETDIADRGQMIKNYFLFAKTNFSRKKGKLCYTASMGMGHTVCIRREDVDQELIALIYDYSSDDYKDYLLIQAKFLQGYTNIDPRQNKTF